MILLSQIYIQCSNEKNMTIKQNIILLIITLNCLLVNYSYPVIYIDDVTEDYIDNLGDMDDTENLYADLKKELENIIRKLQTRPTENHEPSIEHFHDLKEEIEFRSKEILACCAKLLNIAKQKEAQGLIQTTKQVYNQYVKKYSELKYKLIAASVNETIQTKVLIEIINEYDQLKEIN